MDKTKPTLFLIALVVVLCTILYLGIRQYNDLKSELMIAEKYGSNAAAQLKEAGIQYERLDKALVETIRKLEFESEKKSKTTVKVIYRTPENPDDSGPPIQTVCEDCFEAIDIDYVHSDKYFRLHDVLRYNSSDGAFVSTLKDAEYTDEFKKLLVTDVILPVIPKEKIFSLRPILTVDAGYQDSKEDKFTYTGVGVGLEVINFNPLVKSPLAISSYVSVTPQDVSQSHVAAGVMYRVFPNIAIGAFYGRSLTNNMILAGVQVYPW